MDLRSISALAISATALSVAAPAANAGATLATTQVASGLNRPVALAHAPGDTGRLFIVEQRGIIKILDLNTGTVNATSFLNIDGVVNNGYTGNGERGLLGLAFHPDYANNGFFYVNYTNNSSDTIVARYTVSANPDVADAGSATQILFIDQPFTNHNGGWIGFGPDGYLYIGTGDGGSANDPGNRAQDITNQLLGKMLRIDVDGGSPYAIPSDNPFVGVSGDDEIWAYGLRNPWRCSFDRDTGDLYIADVGQNAWEEIDYQPADVGGDQGGKNYGWRCMEGDHCTGLSGCTCNSGSLTDPVHEYSHGVGLSITGGHVYRGSAIPSLDGTYFFADFVFSNRIFSLEVVGGAAVNVTNRSSELSPSMEGITVNQISAFGEDAAGEVYIVDRGGSSSGQIFRIIAEAAPDAASLVSVDVLAGTLISGDLSSIEDSDDVHLTVDSVTQGVRNNVLAEVLAQTDAPSVSDLEVTIEVGPPTVSPVFMSIQLFNVDTGLFQGQYFAIISTNGDTTVVITPTSPEQYVDANGEIRVRIGQTAREPQTPEGFTMLLDQVEVVVTP